MSTKVDPILTVSDLDLMPEDDNRYELFEGEIFMSRAPALPHQRVLTNLVTIFELFLRINLIGKIWPTPGVIFDDFNAVIPDLVFVRSERIAEIASGDKILGAPDLVIEILSEGAENERRDRIIKRQAYSKFGVVEYWIVDRYGRSLEIYSLQNGQLVLTATVKDDDILASLLLPGFECKVRQVFEE